MSQKNVAHSSREMNDKPTYVLRRLRYLEKVIKAEDNQNVADVHPPIFKQTPTWAAAAAHLSRVRTLDFNHAELFPMTSELVNRKPNIR